VGAVLGLKRRKIALERRNENKNERKRLRHSYHDSEAESERGRLSHAFPDEDPLPFPQRISVPLLGPVV